MNQSINQLIKDKERMTAEYTLATEELNRLRNQLTETKGRLIYLEGYIEGWKKAMDEINCKDQIEKVDTSIFGTDGCEHLKPRGVKNDKPRTMEELGKFVETTR